ncbi:hypothetical protein PIROE2DRAFT_17523 [Piromyces sp. E2]|nr:hypothetical protein PIROE2DRAFT_17523 [Piromyces sp. E2]|eukprot:OUM57483.1 hypothetical protein PIROE2DRAFT_17523 [Piromyces sp. E2]
MNGYYDLKRKIDCIIVFRDKKRFLKHVEKQGKEIESYFNGNNLTLINDFVNEINNSVFKPNIKKFSIFEVILKHKLFTNVLAQFRESDVLIRACKNGDRLPAEWLLTMDINYGVKDDYGMTALMYAVKKTHLSGIVKEIMSTNGKHIQLCDYYGNNALFYATERVETLDNFLKYKNIFSPNHVNNDNENIILYCCRYGKMKGENYLDILNKYDCKDPNLTNSEGKTAAMYLAELCKYKELEAFIQFYKIDPNYKNKFGNSILSVFIKAYYTFYITKAEEIPRNDIDGFGLTLDNYKMFSLTLKSLVSLGCDFTIPIDSNNNTVGSILSKMKDEVSIQYLLEKDCIEYSLENKNDNNQEYRRIDETNPVVEKHLKMIKKWATEAYYPDGTIHTRKLGRLMMGYDTVTFL